MTGGNVFKLLKGGQCFCPSDIGRKDLLIAYGKICRIGENIAESSLWDVEIIDCTDRIVCPGFIDQHLHITGGGGEQGPESRIPEIVLSDIVTAGVSTVVGLLGADAVTRNTEGLLAKARALQSEGLNAYIYTGSYRLPAVTLTGQVIRDIAFIDKVIGAGEIAIADFRSSYPSVQQLKELASEVRIGGMIGGKAGVMHVHVGDGREGLSLLFQLIDETDLPMEMFVPTHLNRNRSLFGQAMEYARRGGYIDLTAGEVTGKGYSIPDALELLLGNGIKEDSITLSSDGNGSIPDDNRKGFEVGKVSQLFDDVRSCIVDKRMDIGLILKTVTSNVAKVLKIYPTKGVLSEGSDADVLVLNADDFSIDKLFIMGEAFIDKGNVIKKGKFEN